MTSLAKVNLAGLKDLCQQNGIVIPPKARRDTLIELLAKHKGDSGISDAATSASGTTTDIKRLNYIGSKYQLIDWLNETICGKTGYGSLAGKRVGDLFAGTGIVTHFLRNAGSIVTTNDAELYSYCIARAFNSGVYNAKLANVIKTLNRELLDSRRLWASRTDGYITMHYSPNESCERMFFTPENAQKIDYIRSRIEQLKDSCSPEEHNFLVASLLVSADSVGNVAAVYGCYLKNFKATACKDLILVPVHTNASACHVGNRTLNHDVLSAAMEQIGHLDIAYIDPPYNERQYSKNYFPLNQIAKSPADLESEPPLTGKTGIPTDCFVSPFCSKRTALSSFDQLVSELDAEWVFISYNTEGIVPIDDFIAMLSYYGTVEVAEREYRRFKSYKYNDDKEIKELLLCLHKIH